MQRFTVPILLALAFASPILFFVIPPIAQPQWYHAFADKRTLLGLPHFWNVISNLPFLLVGLWGVRHTASVEEGESIQDSIARWMYLFLFAAVMLTGIGSAYYHLEPNNERLVWDRLPIAMMFMALFAIVIAERINRRAGALLFVPLVLLGAATVWYWHLSEVWGRGDLRPYLLTQIFPVFAIPLILWLCPARHTKTATFYSAIAWYASAKIYEFLDKDLYSFGEILSGHTLKHIGAAVSCYLILSWVRQRRLMRAPTTAEIQPSSQVSS